MSKNPDLYCHHFIPVKVPPSGKTYYKWSITDMDSGKEIAGGKELTLKAAWAEIYKAHGYHGLLEIGGFQFSL